MVVAVLKDLVCLGDSSSAADNNHKKLSPSEQEKIIINLYDFVYRQKRKAAIFCDMTEIKWKKDEMSNEIDGNK